MITKRVFLSALALVSVALFQQIQPFATSSNTMPDTQRPSIKISALVTGLDGATADFTGSVTDSFGVISATWSLNGGNPNNLVVTNDSFAVTGISLETGTNILSVTATDAAGNLGTASLIIASIPRPRDSEPPIITITSLGTAENLPIVQLAGSIIDKTGVVEASWSLNGGPSRILGLGSNGAFNVSDIPLATGNNRFELRAADAEGNISITNIAITNVLLDSSNLLVNVNFTAHLNAAFTVKTGVAAVGHGTNDYWNVYSRDIDSPFNGRPGGTVTNLVTAEQKPTGIDLSIDNAFGTWYSYATDPMLNSYLYPSSGGNITVQLRNVPPGTYDLYVYAHGQLDTENEIVDLKAGADGIPQELATSNAPNWNTGVWQEGRQFVLFKSVSVSPGVPINLAVTGGVSGLAAINGLQLVSAESYVPDTEPPIITITSPHPVLSTNTGPIDIVGSISDDRRVAIAFWSINGLPATDLSLTNGQFGVQSIGLFPGTNTITIFASDATGKQASNSVIVIAPLLDSSNLLVNVNFTAHLNPAFTVKTGIAAAGHGSNDYWNVYSRDIDSPFNGRSGGTVKNLVTAERRPTGIDLSINNAFGTWYSLAADAMLNSYLYPSSGGNITVQLTNIPSGTYDLYVYAHGQLDTEDETVDLTVGVDGVPRESVTSSGPNWNTGIWQEGRQFVLFRSVSVGAGVPINLTVKGGLSGLAAINGLQLVSSGSIIPDTLPPIITISLPNPTANVPIVQLAGSIIDNIGVAQASWSFNGGTSLALALNTNGEFNVSNIALNVGTNLLEVTAIDADGNLAAAHVVVTNAPGLPGDTNAVNSTNMLVNVNFTAHLNPAFSVKTGPAAVGHSNNDFWNVYSRDLDTEFNWRAGGTITNLVTTEKQPTGIDLTVQNAMGAWYTDSQDPMLRSYLYPFGGDISVEMAHVPDGTYDLYVYAHGTSDQENAVIDLTVEVLL